MISLDEFKKLLGPTAETLTDEEIVKIREMEYRLGDIIFDAWLRQRNKSKS
jgi:hypothetical protein